MLCFVVRASQTGGMEVSYVDVYYATSIRPYPAEQYPGSMRWCNTLQDGSDCKPHVLFGVHLRWTLVSEPMERFSQDGVTIERRDYPRHWDSRSQRKRLRV